MLKRVYTNIIFVTIKVYKIYHRIGYKKSVCLVTYEKYIFFVGMFVYVIFYHIIFTDMFFLGLISCIHYTSLHSNFEHRFSLHVKFSNFIKHRKTFI